MSTEKLFHEDPFLLRFEARVVTATEWKGRPSIVLDRTAFYPEGGGQLADVGVLRVGGGVLQIGDVQIDEEGVIHHLVDTAAQYRIAEQTVIGEVDVRRRRDHMSQHTAQHMLSRALLDVADAETVSARLGSQVSTIDLKVGVLTDAQLSQAENLVNEIIFDDRPVRSLFPTSEEMSRLPLRRPPKVERNVRVIEIDGFDHSPCGGTHCTRTSQVGPVHVLCTEKYKGLVRLTFVSGRRCLEDYRAKDAALRSMARMFTCGPLDVSSALDRMRDDAAAQAEQTKWLRERFVRAAAERWLAASPPDASGTTLVLADETGADLTTLRALARAIASRADAVAVVGARDASGDWQVVVERGSRAKFDAGQWFKQQVASVGARGGGRADRAEGRVPASVEWTGAGIGYLGPTPDSR
ncbi:MAG: alanyl-tRNA editing protein [Deltaproteobacteria bacterium]|nr:alanyl-tRNA editing protein [Deltaproteobacteria bacterium]